MCLAISQAKRRTGRYNACAPSEFGFAIQGVVFPLIKITIRSGTNVIAKRERKTPASRLVQASGRNIGLLALSKRKNGEGKRPQ